MAGYTAIRKRFFRRESCNTIFSGRLSGFIPKTKNRPSQKPKTNRLSVVRFWFLTGATHTCENFIENNQTTSGHFAQCLEFPVSSSPRTHPKNTKTKKLLLIPFLFVSPITSQLIINNFKRKNENENSRASFGVLLAPIYRALHQPFSSTIVLTFTYLVRFRVFYKCEY